MNVNSRNEENFIGYEYKDLIVDREKEGVYADGYPNFGWKLEGSSTPIFGISSVNLRFKRDRKIRNKAELTRLQRQFESNVDEIEKLEQSKTTTAMITAFTVGLIGTACMAGSVFAFLGSMIPLCIVLAIPAFIGWVVPYFSFVKLRNKRAEKIAPLLEQQYDSIYEVCEKAHGLLA
jgi:Flp pilus assembly protein TadB